MSFDTYICLWAVQTSFPLLLPILTIADRRASRRCPGPVKAGSQDTRKFSATANTAAPNLNHPLIWSVDWDRVLAGAYAIVDPHSPTSILYLSKKEYLKLTGICVSNEQDLVVLAVAGDSKPKCTSIKSPKPENSPPALRVGHAMFWRGLRSRLARSYRSFIDPDRKTFKSKHLHTHLSGLVKRWSIALAHWSSFPKTASGWFKDIQAILPHLLHVLKTQGTNGLVLRLKVSYLLISQYLADTPKLSHAFGHPVSVSHGLPRWIPVHARHAIRQRSPRVIRFWLSLLYLYKVLEAPAKAGKVLKGIVRAPVEFSAVHLNLLEKYRKFLRVHYIPSIGGVRPIPQNVRSTFFTPVASGPNGSPAIEHAHHDAIAIVNDRERGGKIMDNIATLAGIFKIKWDDELVTELAQEASDEILEDVAKAVQTKTKPPKLQEPEQAEHSVCYLFKEAAGKVRAVAIMDIFTQRVLKPLHNDLFAVLKTIRQDGTWDQNGLLAWLKSQARGAWSKYFWSSLDISAATDSIPRIFYKILLEELYGRTEVALLLAETVLSLMTDRSFAVRHEEKVELEAPFSDEGARVRYGTGQPMGCLGSFGLLALWNNSWVNFAHFLVHGTLCKTYGVTGDDVVIAEPDNDGRVGTKYRELCGLFDISISLPKSFLSSKLFNFLSRTVLEGVEISPTSLKEEFSIVDSATRVVRTLKLRDRDWWSSNDSGWLSKAVKYFLYPSEYLAFQSESKHGTLNGYGLRAVMAFLSPSSNKMQLLGLSSVPVFGWLSAFAGSTVLLAHGEAVRNNSLLPRGVGKHTLYLVLVELLTVLLQEIFSTMHKNFGMHRHYTAWYRKQKWFLQDYAISYLFLPDPVPPIHPTSGNDYKWDPFETQWIQRGVAEYGEAQQGLVARLGPEFWKPENIQGAILKALKWKESLPVGIDFSKPNYFQEQANIHHSRRVSGEDDMAAAERLAMSILFRCALLYPGQVNLDLSTALADLLERRFINLFSGACAVSEIA